MLRKTVLGPIGALCLAASVVTQGYSPSIQPASVEGRNAIRKFRVPSDLRVSLVAAEPDLANPVAFCIDTKGRIFVAETFRLHKGVTDNRSHQDWIDEELACRTVADRVRMYERRFEKTIDDWKREHERVRMLRDTNGDGVVDRSTVFADGFKDLADGIGAGLLAYEGRVYFTCIPKLWLLEDVDDDGVADRRKPLHDGYGVHTSLLGHDLHGLRIGPDGKLYFSIGDRGFHVVTPERTLSFPDEGAVLRCNLDGTELEVVHRGLRNPQELAFDELGNLFTGDNNSDGGDKARWVYVVEGGHSGWHIGFQSLSDRGPWNREKLWHPHFRGQAAYIVPPITNLINGPSGLTHHPGVGLLPRYRGHFFLCEFRGMSSMSGVVALRLVPKGASFELTDKEEFFWNILPTDVEFGFDGSLYVSDWTEGWGQTGKGRIYRVAIPGWQSRRSIVAQGIEGMSTSRILGLMNNADERIRQSAQFALVKKGCASELASLARSRGRRLPRLHGIWGMGQLGRKDPKIVEGLLPLLAASDHEIRCQVAKVLGDCRVTAAVAPLIQQLSDRSSRARFFAAIALGKIGDPAAIEPLIAMLRADDERDPYLRHAGVMGLTGMPDEIDLLRHATDASRAVRLGLVVALRKRQSLRVTRFLDDPDPLVVLEAARAIHDEPIDGGMPELAALLNRPGMTDEHLLRRAINANFRVGSEKCLARVVWFATRGRATPRMRANAVDALAQWAAPSGRDRVINLWRPLPKRDRAAVVRAIEPHLTGLLTDAPEPVRLAAVDLCRRYERREAGAELAQIVAADSGSGELRVAALRALKALAWRELETSVRVAVAARPASLRKMGLRMLAELDPKATVPVLAKMISSDAPLGERQNALSVLGDLEAASAEAVLAEWMDRLLAGTVPRVLELDLVEAAAARKSPALDEKLDAYKEARSDRADGDLVASYAEALVGGNRSEGDRVFWGREDAASCKKCHMIHGWGGNAGPDLTLVHERLTREQILASLLEPGREIAKGFETSVYTLRDGRIVAGMVSEETATEFVVVDTLDNEVHVKKSDIERRSKPGSSMPPMAGLLTRRELRDLVEFLEQPKKKRD